MLTTPLAKNPGIVRSSSGSVVGDGTALTINLGFNPSCFDLVNSTDATVFRKIAGMAANACVKQVTGGTLTVDTSSQILFNGDGTVTVAAATAAAGKALAFFAE